jgi:ABC-type glycerol-3-phosphate transport system substrate-binding protein
MKATRYRKLAAVSLAVAFGLTGAACGNNKSDDSSTGGSSSAEGPLDPNAKVSISIDCMPPTSKPAERKEWQEDVAAFNKKYPNVTIDGKDGFPCEEPPKFTAQLKAGTEADVFYSYFTDLPQVLDAGQAADITKYVNAKTIPQLDSIDPSVLDVLKDDGKYYGLPTSNYKMGLIYNRKLFQQAGLDPDKPPTTWDDVAADAKKIAALGNGVIGYGEYSAQNTGGWHYTAQLYGLGGSMVSDDGKKAAFNTDLGRQALQHLYDMRWKDNSVGTTQGYKWPDLMRNMTSGKEGMYLGAPDDITYMVQTLGGNYNDYGMGPMPGGKATLTGGNDYFFKKGLTADQIKAGIAFINFKYLTQGQGQFDYARTKADGLPVGLPEPLFWKDAAQTKDDSDKATSATIPVANFKPYVSQPVPAKVEPVQAQEIYKVLDTAVSAVLTDQNADVKKLLDTAEQQVNTVLANAQ